VADRGVDSPGYDKTRPSRWLTDNLDLIPKGRPVLDVASGRGRHARAVAEAGWHVHAVDRDASALATIDPDSRFRGAIATEVIDLEADTVSLGQSIYAAVLVFNYLHRPLMPVLIEALAPGGVLIYETFTRGQAARGHPRTPAFLLDAGELPRLVRPLDVVRSFEGERDGSLIAAVVARR
jgi:SAM-dependent methyltransferase